MEEGVKQMSDRFELSFRNKEVRIWLAIMIPATIAAVVMIIFTETTTLYSTAILTVAWLIFLGWRYFYRRRQRRETSIT